jgi:hypothetical protein
MVDTVIILDDDWVLFWHNPTGYYQSINLSESTGTYDSFNFVNVLTYGTQLTSAEIGRYEHLRSQYPKIFPNYYGGILR